MKRRLVFLSMATTILVVVAFVVPLALLVRRQAADGAKATAESRAQSAAALVALAIAVDGGPTTISGVVGELPPGTIVVLDGSTIVGEAHPGQGSLAARAAESMSAIAADVPGGWEVALPVVGPTEIVVVDSFVSDRALAEGVARSWLMLAGLAVLLVAVAVWVAAHMGRTLTEPVEALARSAHRLAEGELDTRVDPVGPVEIGEVGEAFNYLADRLAQLLAEEREQVADLSHRLRTPLTSLRLQAEAIRDPDERKAMVEQVDRVEHATNRIIELARSPAALVTGESDLNEVVERRSEFWRVLAEEQGRVLSVVLTAGPGRVHLGEEQVEVLIDTLVGNVFSHTPPGTGFQIRTGSDRGGSWLEVADDGPGFGDSHPVARGVSGGGSTGLGLDIARKVADSVGGTVHADDRPEGGAVVRVGLG